MPKWASAYVRYVEALNYRVGRFAMYLLFAMMGVLLWSSVTKVANVPALWTLEMAQFILVAYYLLGAPYTFQLDTNVRMDLLYARQSPRKKAIWDAITVFVLIFYLGVMLYGALGSTAYSFATSERAPTAWRPYLWPIKTIICASFVLMILQAVAHLIRDVAIWRGKAL
ncbi:TRAP transporter small permease subunit [Loktanella sp. R86503]|uniref:TRAP transporter small permease subunit n=1 Tax=Loktanella TaxID=245186 RepID=UPI0036DE878C